MSGTTTAPAESAGAESSAETGTPGTATGTSVPPGEEGKHFPPLDTAKFPSQIFWLVIFFALLYVLMSKVVLPKLAKILDNRAARIESDLARAQALKDETEAAVKAYEKAYADARGKATAIAQDTRDQLAAETDKERAALEATLAGKIAAAEAQIARSRAAAMKDVDSAAADTAAEIVAQLTGAKIGKADAAKAVAGAVKG